MKGQDLDHIRALNRRKILRCIRRAGEISRSEIAAIVDVSPATVSVVSGELLTDGLIEIVEPRVQESVGRGRPKTLLRLRPEAAYAIGIKLTYRQAAVSITNFAGEVLTDQTAPMSRDGDSFDEVVDQIADQIGRVLADAGLELDQLLGVGLGVPGCVEHETGRVGWSPMFDQPGYPLRAALEERIGCNVVVDNESNLVGLAEKWFGLGQGHSSYVVVTVEHGVGMSIVVNSEIYRGHLGYAGEFGHTTIALDGLQCRCGRKGCVETYVADYALVREAKDLVGDVPLNDQTAIEQALNELASLADAGNAKAVEIFAEAGRILGVALGNAVNTLDPSIVIISGRRASRPTKPFMDAVKAAMEDQVLPSNRGAPPVLVHGWGDDLWARGAAALVLEEFMPENSLSRSGGQEPAS